LETENYINDLGGHLLQALG